MSTKPESSIRRLQKTAAGEPEDGVEMMAKCSVMNFTVKKNKVTGVGSQRLANCKLMASFENGVVSVSVRGDRPFMVSVRLEEVMALLKEAADYNLEKYPKEEKKDE